MSNKAIHYNQACIQGNIRILELLLKYGADVNFKDQYGNTSLQNTAYNGCVEAVKWLLERGADVNAANDSGTTALIRACEYPQTGSYSCIGGRVFRCRKGSEEEKLAIVQALVQAGAKIDSVNEFHYTPMSQACAWKYLTIGKYLAEQGADLDAALKSAKEYRCQDLVRYIRQLKIKNRMPDCFKRFFS